MQGCCGMLSIPIFRPLASARRLHFSIRAGFGVFRYQIAYNTIQVPSEDPLGVANATIPPSGGFTSLSQISGYSPSKTTNEACGTGCSIQAMALGDGHVPYTEDYNLRSTSSYPAIHYGRSLMSAIE